MITPFQDVINQFLQALFTHCLQHLSQLYIHPVEKTIRYLQRFHYQ